MMTDDERAQFNACAARVAVLETSLGRVTRERDEALEQRDDTAILAMNLQIVMEAAIAERDDLRAKS